MTNKQKKNSINELKKAKKILGGISQMAKACEVRYQSASAWFKNGCPPDKALIIEKVTKTVSPNFFACKKKLRPDYWS